MRTVSKDRIETIVGTTRSKTKHYARAVSAAETVYLLHSKECVDAGTEQTCEFSQALEKNGISLIEWRGFEDRPVEVLAVGSWLTPKEAVKWSV